MPTATEVQQRDTYPEVTPATRLASVGSRLLTQLERLARWSAGQLTHPRTRTAVIGVVLILVGALLVSAPFWTFVLVVIGLVMVLTAWVGSRLEGRFAVEWSDAGAGFEMRARFKSISAPAPALAGAAPAPTSAPTDASASAEPGDGDQTIDGEAHTIELNLDELKALIAAIDQGHPTSESDAAEPQTETPEPVPAERSEDTGASGARRAA